MTRRTTGLMAALAIVILLCNLTGCVAIQLVDTRYQRVSAEGPLVEYQLPGGEFTKVDLAANLEVIYESRASDTVRLEIQENLYPYLQVSVDKGKLTVKSDAQFTFPLDTQAARLYVSTPVLEELSVSGALTLKESDAIVGDQFTLEISGAGDVDIAVDVADLDVYLWGAGQINLRGEAVRASLDISGAGSINGYELETMIANVHMSGAASVDIRCSDHLTVDVSGAGTVNYYGDPEVRKSVSGAASVQQRKG